MATSHVLALYEAAKAAVAPGTLMAEATAALEKLTLERDAANARADGLQRQLDGAKATILALGARPPARVRKNFYGLLPESAVARLRRQVEGVLAKAHALETAAAADRADLAKAHGLGERIRGLNALAERLTSQPTAH